MNTYTIALATRLKRKVFRAKNIPRDVIRLTRIYLEKEGKELLDYKFYDYGFVVCIKCKNNEQPEKAAAGIRKETSRPIRSMYPELWSMPSLWNSRPLVVEGGMTDENMETVQKYYDSLKSR